MITTVLDRISKSPSKSLLSRVFEYDNLSGDAVHVSMYQFSRTRIINVDNGIIVSWFKIIFVLLI